jgi:glycosyltransferase involved in cell wall biosynthesis
MPARDAAGTLPSALRSIARQSLHAWECIVVDDGSRDETASIAADAARLDARIRLVTTPPAGIVAALNTGLAQCRAPYVARMDADDVMRADRLERQRRALDAEAGLAAVGSHVRLCPRASLSAGRRAYEHWLNSIASARDVRRDRFVECPLAHPTVMIRRGVLLAYRYRDEGWAEDYDLILRMLEDGLSLGVVPRRLVLWRDHATRLSRTARAYGIDRFTACKAAFLARGFLRGQTTYVLWGYGDTGRSLAAALEAHGRVPERILEVHPGRIGQRIRGVPVSDIGELPSLHGRPIIVSVAGAGPRAEIRAWMASAGFIEDRDYVVAA